MSNISTFLAADDPIGKISPPSYIPSGISGGKLTGIVAFLNSLLRLVFIVAGIWALINFIIAGIGFMTAGGDPKAVGKAWERIYWTFIGLLIVVSSFILAAIVGMLFFGSPTAILQPTLE